MRFEKTKFKDLINAEGAILEIVKDLENSFYLKAFCLNGNGYIYSKLNKETLKAYFENKMTLKELYLSGINEQYFVKTKSEIPPVIKPMRLTINDFIFSTLECGNALYSELSKNMILENPIEEIIDKL
ncbi:MAG: hypothetical protein WCG08_15390 [Paludibacter sp.]